MRDLDTPEIHGYLPEFGYRVYSEKAIEMVGEWAGATSNGHRHAVSTVSGAATAPQKPPKKKQAKDGGLTAGQNLPEIGQDDLLGQQQPGDAVARSS